jgi:hypothetical protein
LPIHASLSSGVASGRRLRCGRREIVSRFKAGDESGGALEFAWSLILLMLFEVRLDRDLARSCIGE